MQRKQYRAAGGGGLGAVDADVGEDRTDYQLAAALVIAGTTAAFKAQYTAPDRYVFEARGVVLNTAAETVSLGFSVTTPNVVSAGAVSLAYMIPSAAAAAAGTVVGWGATSTLGSAPAIDIAFAANQQRPFTLWGGFRILDGVMPGEMVLNAVKTAGAGTLSLQFYGRFQCHRLVPSS